MNRAFGALRLGIAAAIVYSIGWQVTDRMAHNVFRPAEYFSYFTIQTSLLTAVILVLSGLTMWSGADESPRLTKLRLVAASASIVVGIVYNLLLRDSAPAAADGDYKWPVLPNEILHVWAPTLVFLDWLLSRNAQRLAWLHSLNVVYFPLAWLAFSVIRGNLDGWWPYWFLDPTDQGGLPQMLQYIGAITAFFIAIGFVLGGLNRLVVRRA